MWNPAGDVSGVDVYINSTEKKIKFPINISRAVTPVIIILQ